MTMFKSMAFAGTVAALSSLSFAWSIDGVVSSKAGQPLSGVKISSFNYAGLEAVSAADGKFALSYDDGVGLQMLKSVQAHVGFNHNVITISGIKAQTLTVSVMDALGKVAFSRTLHNVFGLATFDLNKTNARGAKYIRINADGNRNTYQLGKNVTLMKDGDPLPTLMFAKEGYNNFTYTMKSFTESNVQITMDVASAQQSSSSQAIASSSSAKPESSAASSSSAKIEEVINCTGKTYQAGDHKMSVNVDGKNRTFIMHVPSAYKGDKPVPLVVDYHPVMGSGQGQLSGTTYKAQTDPEGVISLYPDGTKSADSRKMGPGWNVGPCCSDDDDVKFSREMIKSVEEKVCIDKKRVYATGFSMGGGMSNHVACFMSDVYAAVAPAGMDLNKTNSATCNPERPISIIMFRGTNDNVCRYQGGDSGFNDGLNFLGAEGNFQFWAQKNGCTGSPSKNSNGCNEYSNCKDGTKVVLCTKQGGGHEQGDGKVGWPFLKSFTLP
ncbi:MULTISPECIES: PHB depolymerase family esterase [unclassified Fibrobacter]|uniref:alpha/beta hydrolase family esterase n=1 Tax=unclassified Fibrobacter TaxID=2634177 RepID=UPI00091B10AE|nr:MULTISPECIES: PHB depolymerase family esterase [unclassified Fibrobacter]SHM73817.1 polyhydroxybutyrate depolymerase [Fibrobacter sp. UWB7]SMG32035.1 polyhydroxybutyrate depolymerase [Fibrobacter sp. UWB13]